MTTAATGGGGSGLPIELGTVATFGLAGLILAVGVLTLALIVIFSRRRAPETVPVPVPVGATVSPDGLCWWDGASWRPTH